MPSLAIGCHVRRLNVQAPPRSRVTVSAAETVSAEEVKDALRNASSSNREAASKARKFRRDLNKQDTYTRRVRKDESSVAQMQNDGVGYSRTGLVARLRSQDYQGTFGDVTITLAKAYGFCWGVERAVQMAYEARSRHPSSKLYITNEIIHNPSVNERLEEMGVTVIDVKEGEKDFSVAEKGDVVILPAFGASVQEMRLLADRGVNIVDTTCPWVSKVWTAVDKQATKAHTSVIHGKYSHEETVATASFAGDYIIVKDMKEAQYVSDYILHGGNKEEFLEKFKFAVSPGFDPETLLESVGIANQTTMLKGETQAIGKLFEKTMLQKFGPENLSKHFMVMDTICDATQVATLSTALSRCLAVSIFVNNWFMEFCLTMNDVPVAMNPTYMRKLARAGMSPQVERQDAMYELTDGREKIDMMLVVGGFNSSNTSHLQEISEHKNIPSFWVCSEDCIDVENNTIQHKTSWGELQTTQDWLTRGNPINIGITSGASTPDSDVEAVLDRVLRIMDDSFTGVEPLATPLEVVSPH